MKEFVKKSALRGQKRRLYSGVSSIGALILKTKTVASIRMLLLFGPSLLFGGVYLRIICARRAALWFADGDPTLSANSLAAVTAKAKS